jgi:hypothetical protein
MSEKKVIKIKVTPLPSDLIRSPETPKKVVATFAREKSVYWATPTWTVGNLPLFLGMELEGK